MRTVILSQSNLHTQDALCVVVDEAATCCFMEGKVVCAKSGHVVTGTIKVSGVCAVVTDSDLIMGLT